MAALFTARAEGWIACNTREIPIPSQIPARPPPPPASGRGRPRWARARPCETMRARVKRTRLSAYTVSKNYFVYLKLHYFLVIKPIFYFNTGICSGFFRIGIVTDSDNEIRSMTGIKIVNSIGIRFENYTVIGINCELDHGAPTAGPRGRHSCEHTPVIRFKGPAPARCVLQFLNAQIEIFRLVADTHGVSAIGHFVQYPSQTNRTYFQRENEQVKQQRIRDHRRPWILATSKQSPCCAVLHCVVRFWVDIGYLMERRVMEEGELMKRGKSVNGGREWSVGKENGPPKLSFTRIDSTVPQENVKTINSEWYTTIYLQEAFEKITNSNVWLFFTTIVPSVTRRPKQLSIWKAEKSIMKVVTR
ncbi:hypothetical protein EVAR_96374_1 [Eumeta japonica]|uniref:Uncharacterized protein n=1 Tax=Eumeta variegata TaxID=151549 RepID=A0A4C1WDV7_EUMVA|nr:hypothetical protein EVAR_96374_1 [Eumeta japonica]